MVSCQSRGRKPPSYLFYRAARNHSPYFRGGMCEIRRGDEDAEVPLMAIDMNKGFS
jgi:hypothetical protein